MGRVLLVLGVAALFTQLVSCEPDECTQRFKSDVQGTFYRRDTLGNQEFSEVSLFSLYGIGRKDSLLYDSIVNVDIFTFPLSPDYNSRSFVMVSDSIRDTLTFTYSSSLQLINTICGFVPNYELRKVENTTNFIEAVQISNSDVNTDEKENIKVYLK